MKCRCDLCKACAAAYRKAYRSKKEVADRTKEYNIEYRNREGMKERAAQYQRNYRKKHPERSVANTRRQQARAKAIRDAAKSVPCKDCGVSYPPYVMDFDHVPERGEKMFNLDTKSWSRPDAIIEEEMAKCDVVCSNCHRERTMNRLSTMEM